MKTKRAVAVGGAVLVLTAGIFFGATFNSRAQFLLQAEVAQLQPVQEKPDSLVRIVAESQGLPVVPFEKLPRNGTYWEALDPFGRVLPPMPFLPLDPNAVVYQMADGQFLVDNGQATMIPQPLQRSKLPPLTPEEFVAKQVATLVGLVDQVQTAQQTAELKALAGETDEKSLDGEDGGGMSARSFLSFPDPGLRIVVPTNALAVPTQLAVILTNTIPDEPYDVLTKSDLNAPAWAVEVAGIYAPTNFIPVQLSRNGRTNLFVWARFAGDSTGSGIPDWWLLQYFGTTDVDPYGDADGDGWNNLQEYQNGTDPTQRNTPPAPSGLIVDYNEASGAVNVNWQLSRGPVTGYALVIHQYNGGTVTLNFSASTTSFATNISAVTSSVSFLGPTKFVSFKVKAQYALGDSSWSDPVLLEPNFILPPEETFNSYDARYPFLPISLIAGPQGSAYLAATALPPGTEKLRLTRIDHYAEDNYNNHSFNTNWDIPVSSFTNGLYQLPASWLVTKKDSYGEAYYDWWVQTVNASNGPSMASVLDYYASAENAAAASWPVPLYFDGRAQMKENLIFLLRAATINYPFAFTPDNTGGAIQYYYFSMFPNYACSGYYQPEEYYHAATYLDVFLPVANNYLFRNFVFSLSDVNTNGYLTNGVVGVYPDDATGMYLNVPPRYWFPVPLTNGAVISTLLATNQTRWLCMYGLDYGPVYLSEIAVNYVNHSMPNNAVNIYGLPFLSAESAQLVGSSVQTNLLYAGSSITNGGYFYAETAQPQLQILKYDFWQAGLDWLPGHAQFSPTTSNHVLIASVGDNLSVAGYAKLGLQNGYNNAYGYLGQYFDQAYAMGTNGVATTNSAGILSPYGEFFPTYPGPAALVTMPDLDTGQRGTGVVNVVKLQLDVNHDGVMDLSFGGPDNTSQANPFAFWINNDFDRINTVDLTDSEQDDLPKATCPFTPRTLTPDYAYRDASGNQTIPCMRDLEDYTRLWIPGLNSAMAAMPTNYTVMLTLTGDEQIRIYRAYENSGATNYLFDPVTASNQVANSTSLYVGLLSSSSPIVLNHSWGEHFIWCGAARGNGQLTLSIIDGTGTNLLAQTSAWIELKDIKEMYERWTVGDRPLTNGVAGPTSVAYAATEGLSQAFKYLSPTETNTPYILFVHGWNMAVWDKDRFAETSFKRLYWQGYQGRFGFFRWPTYFDFPFGELAPQAFNPRNYDDSESNAWASAKGLLNKLTGLNAQYPGHVYLAAHSMGNVVAGEALRLATNQVVNTYVALQAAVSAHAYDTNTPTRNSSASTPDNYAHYWTNGAPCYFNSNAGAGTYVNFYNTNDYALTGSLLWPYDQDNKPDHGVAGFSFQYPGYYYLVSSLHPNGFYAQFGSGTNDFHNLNFPGDTYAIFSYCDQARSYALGAQADVGGQFSGNQVGLDGDPYGFSTQHKFHSGEFRSDNAKRWPFWNQVLVKFKLKQP